MGPEHSESEPTRAHDSDEPSAVLPTRRSTLQERRSKDGQTLVGLSLETLQESCQRSEESPSEAISARFRGWSINEEGRNIPTTCPGSIRLMSYNILAGRYVSTDRYPHCPTSVLSEGYRSKQIVNEVQGIDPDIACFQEMSLEMHNHDDMLGCVLRSQFGYASEHVVITAKNGSKCHVNTFAQEMRSDFEGVSIFFKSVRFELLETVPIRFNLEAEIDKTLTAAERQRLQVASHNVALILVLRDRCFPELLYIVGTTHALWDAQKPECQTWQMHQLVVKAQELKMTYEDLGTASVLLCGDLNAESGSAPLHYALHKAILPNALMEQWRSYPITHNINLMSSYTYYCLRHPGAVSAVNPSNNGDGKVIDHILYDRDGLVCVAVGRLGEKKNLPSRSNPSDHYPLAAILVPIHCVTFVEAA